MQAKNNPQTFENKGFSAGLPAFWRIKLKNGKIKNKGRFFRSQLMDSVSQKESKIALQCLMSSQAPFE